MTQCQQHFFDKHQFLLNKSRIFFHSPFFATNNFRINFQQQQLSRSPSINCLIFILMTRSTNLRGFSTNILTPQGFEQITWYILCHNVSKYQRSHSPPNSVFEFSIAIDYNKFSPLWVIPFDSIENQHAGLIELDFSNEFSPMTGNKCFWIQKSITTIKNYYWTGIDSKLFNQISKISQLFNFHPVDFSVLTFGWFMIIPHKQWRLNFKIERYQEHWHVMNFN